MPVYSPTVVYGTWAYPAYPPPPVYPPGLRHGWRGDQLQHRVRHRLELLALSALSAVPAAATVPAASPARRWEDDRPEVSGRGPRRAGGVGGPGGPGGVRRPGRSRQESEARAAPAVSEVRAGREAPERGREGPNAEPASGGRRGGESRARPGGPARRASFRRAAEPGAGAGAAAVDRDAERPPRRREAATARRWRRRPRLGRTLGEARASGPAFGGMGSGPADPRRQQPGHGELGAVVRRRRRREALSDDDPSTHDMLASSCSSRARCSPRPSGRTRIRRPRSTPWSRRRARARSRPSSRSLGEPSRSVLVSGDAVSDSATLRRFVELYDRTHTLSSRRTRRPGRWSSATTAGPSPIPLVKGTAGWTFDTKAGEKEILARRVGQNELDTIQVCLGYVGAQRGLPRAEPRRVRACRTTRTGS